MGLEARDYMRRGGGGGGLDRLSLTTRLIIANVLIWFVYATSASWGGTGGGLYGFITEYLALHPRDVFGRLRLWQPLTAVWLHDPLGLGHIFFNMLFLYFFGRVVESMLDRRSYLALYVGGGVVSALALIPLGYVWPLPPAYGASGAVYAVGVFAALRAPHLKVFFLFVPMSLWVLVFGFMVGREVLSIALRMGALGTSVGHLAGAAFGYVFERRLRGPVSTAGRARRSEAEDAARMDRLLEKIHAEGIGSLSAKEKDFLERRSRRYGR